MAKEDESDLKQKLKQEEIKDRIADSANEMFSKGFTNLAIRDELTVYFPEITEENVQGLREKWEQKHAADMEMMDRTEGRKETPLPSQKDFVDYLKPKIKGYEEILDKVFGKTRWRHWVRYDVGGFAFPSVEDWVELTKVLNLDDTFDLSEIEQTGVFDEPKPTEGGMEEKIIERETEKKLGEEISYEKAGIDLEEKKAGIEGTEIRRATTPSLRDDIQKEMIREEQQQHVEIVRATEELRRAITSEIRAQESYEDAKKKMESTEKEMIRVRSELDKFKQSVDLLKMKDRIYEREEPKEPKLESTSPEFKRFEEEVSKRGFERVVEDIIEDVAHKKDVEKVDEIVGKEPSDQRKMPEEPVIDEGHGKNGRVDDIAKDLYRNNVISIEKLAGYLGISVEEAHSLGIERKVETLELTVGEEPVEEVKVIPEEDTIVKVADALNITVDDARRLIAEKQTKRKIDKKTDEKPVTPSDKGKPEEDKTDKRFREDSEPKKFYDKVMRYLNIHPYLVVKKEGNKPEVYKLRLKLVGLLYGIGIGIPSGCLLLYALQLIAGVL